MSKKEEKKDEETGVMNWLKSKFQRAKNEALDVVTELPGKAARKMLGIDDWAQGTGMLVTAMAVMGMGRQWLGDNIVSVVASTALGIATAYLFKDKIKTLTDGISSFFNSSSGAAEKKPAPAAQVAAPTPAGP